MLKSHFKGSGLQFKEHQVYNYGDDIRFIDWRRLAKTSEPYIKTFEEERNVEIAIVLDASPSMFMGHEGVSKLQAAIEICCLLYLLAEETDDKVHVIIISSGETNIPMMSGEKGISALISQLELLNIIGPDGNVRIMPDSSYELTNKEKMNSIMKHLGFKREIVILSDLVELFDASDLRRLVYRRHVHCFQILCPLDEAEKLPFAPYGFDSLKTRKGAYKGLNLDGMKEMENILGPKLKRLRVQERYLEEFIKEML